MAKKMQNAISPTRTEDYPEWYQQVIKAAELAENSPVRGCMVIKPWGYAIWENIQRVLDKMFKDTGHVNAYFPIFIPKSFLEKEAEHVEGFAKECAVVTHHRLEADGEGGLKPAGELEEPLVVRPTSETIIGAMFSKWVQSYRDLPLLINQWANVVRWEMRTRLFLRTTEFLWQEGHTVHSTKEEAIEETLKMLDVYADFAQNYMAMPVLKGQKTENEKFPGAETTYCIEAMMQDRKALQAGTSHFLGQNFSKASEIQFSDKDGQLKYAWTTSWGVSTRLVGGLIMTHSDDDGLVLPPRLAPLHVIILPVIPKEEQQETVMNYCEQLQENIQKQCFDGLSVKVDIDRREMSGGRKKWDWVKKGVPIRLEVGPRDVESNAVFMSRRDLQDQKGQTVNRDAFVQQVVSYLDDIQNTLYHRALDHRQNNTRMIDSKEEFYAFFTPENADKPEIHGGFVRVYWAGDSALEDQLQKDLNVTIRCIPLEQSAKKGICPFTEKETEQQVIFGKSY